MDDQGKTQDQNDFDKDLFAGIDDTPEPEPVQKPVEEEKPETKQNVEGEIEELKRKVAQNTREVELANLMASDTKGYFKGKVNEIRKLMNNPATANLKLEAIAKLTLSTEEIEKQALENYKKEQSLGQSSSFGGSTGAINTEAVSDVPDVSKMTTEEFKADMERRMRQG